MKRVLLVSLVMVFAASAGCGRHVVMARDAGRVDGERSITTASDTKWSVDGEPRASER